MIQLVPSAYFQYVPIRPLFWPVQEGTFLTRFGSQLGSVELLHEVRWGALCA